ncbi:MAG TPA: septation protein A [Noviherbaspirillum sp.]|nr:septation protein A [Noviherbaspirillum sp.]
MKFLFDLFPVILFFAMFKWGEGNPDAAQSLAQQYLGGLTSGAATSAQAPIMLATAIAILATFAQIGYLLLRRRKVDGMLWVSLAIITVFGGATIYFNNETFIKWKPTVLYWCFGAALVVAHMLFGKNLIRLMMEKQIALPDLVWQRLNLSWAGFFAAMGLVNLYVAYSFPTAFWVNFKLFGFTGLMIAFVVAQSVFLSKHVKDQR